MKLKINKAANLDSISVLPPQSRSSMVSSGLVGGGVRAGSESSIFAKNQASTSQFRNSSLPPPLSQSQQSFSQGMPLSQLSQNSFDEMLTNEQGVGSQERENFTKRFSCLAPVSHCRDENWLAMGQSSTNMLGRWNQPSAPDHRNELEHRFGMIDTALDKLRMILDSVQGDVIQMNKSIKEVSLEMQALRQKMTVQDDTLQHVLREEEAIKNSQEGSFKTICEQLRKESNQPKLQEILGALTSMPNCIEARLLKLKVEKCSAVNKEVTAIKGSNVTSLPPNHQTGLVYDKSPHNKVVYEKKVQKEEQGLEIKSEWKRVYSSERIDNSPCKKVKPVVPPPKQEEKWRIFVSSDEDDDEVPRGFGPSSFAHENIDEETREILRRARRKRRSSLKKSRNLIIKV